MFSWHLYVQRSSSNYFLNNRIINYLVLDQSISTIDLSIVKMLNSQDLPQKLNSELFVHDFDTLLQLSLIEFYPQNL